MSRGKIKIRGKHELRIAEKSLSAHRHGRGLCCPAEMLERYRKLIDEEGHRRSGAFFFPVVLFPGQCPDDAEARHDSRISAKAASATWTRPASTGRSMSLTSPGVQIFDADTGTALATSCQADQLAEAVAKHPDRLSGSRQPSRHRIRSRRQGTGTQRDQVGVEERDRRFQLSMANIWTIPNSPTFSPAPRRWTCLSICTLPPRPAA